MSSGRTRVAVVGAGYWGINHVRAWSQQRGAELVAICDPSSAALARTRRFAPTARHYETYEQLLEDQEVEALVLATPAIHHAHQAEAGLRSGRHVLVEKPLALSPADAARAVAAAEESGRTLMVGHLMLYHPAYERVRGLVTSGELGDLYYLYAVRVNLGKLRTDENALWSLAPHDLSMILDLLGTLPTTVAARGQSFLQQGIEDVVFVNLTFDTAPVRRMAQVQVSWLDPRKERRLTLVGSRKMVEFDDGHPTDKLRIYDKGYDRPPPFTQYGEYLTLRHGDVHLPRVDMAEPLDLECRHFLDCIQTGQRPRSDGAQALAVVQVLDAAQRSLLAGGAPVSCR